MAGERMLWVGLLVLFLSTAVASDSCTGAESCPDSSLCGPQEECLASSPTLHCGNQGTYLTCGYEGQEGVVTKECGSGKNADCSDTQVGTIGGCGVKTYEGILCDYPELAPQGTATANWQCGDYGTRMTCKDYVPDGGALVGVCGAGGNHGCQGLCNPAGAHAVLCSKNANNLNWKACKWISGGYGEWVECPKGYVGAGHCGSGRDDDCGTGIWHELLCCPYEYPFTYSGYGIDFELRQDIIQDTQKILGTIITEAVTKAVNSIPSVSTKHAGVSHITLSEFELSDGELFNSPNGFSYKFVVSKFKFSLYIDLKFVESCEWIVSFTANQGMPLIIPFEFDMTGPKLNFSTSPFWYTQTSKAIDYNEQCNSPFCNLNGVCLASRGPLHRFKDIFDSAWNAIPTAVGAAVNGKVSPIVDHLPLVVKVDILGEGVGVDFRGQATSIQTTSYDQVESPVFQNLAGFFLVKDDVKVYSPFPPTTPVKRLDTPPEQITIYLTDYFFHSFIWAFSASGALNRQLPPGAIPAGSPFQLNTGNLIMRTIAPGLRHQGSQPMIMIIDSTTYANSSHLTISSNGITTSNNSIITSYYLYNTTTKEVGDFLFSVDQEFSANLDVTTEKVVGTDDSERLELAISINRLRCDSTTTVSSNVGYVNNIAATSYTESAMLVVQQTLFSKPFYVPLPIPGKLFRGGGKLQYTDDNYMFIGGDFFGGDEF